MADIIYKVTQDDPNSIQGFEQFSQADKDLIGTFEVNNLFDPNKHISEIHIYTLVDELIESHYNYTNYKQLGNAQSAGKSGASILTIDPIADSKLYGYDNGGIKLLYNFINDLYSNDKTTIEFFIDSISEDRTEIRLGSLMLSSDDILKFTNTIKESIQSTSYFSEFRLNFKNNDLVIGINIDTIDYNGEKAVVVKLYEPLPTTYDVKNTLNIVEIISDSIAFEVDSDIIIEENVQPLLKPANFNLEVIDEHVIPTQYYTYEELFSYPVNNSNNQIYSMINEKGAEISVDYSDFSNFTHFSSAYERLVNFKYKLDLITSYSSSIATTGSATTGLQGVSGSRTYYENLITGIVNNFDHYERFLYYESGSNSWPKSNNTKPYINKSSTSTEAINWYTQKITTANNYDNTNYSSIIYTVPAYLRDDQNNENYMIFLYMVGQHFDNLWLYSKAVTDKYNADNRIGYGISKDLVGEALKNFGVKLYTSNKSIEDLFTTFIGQSYQSGSEVINHYITGSLTGSNTPIQPVSYDDYNKEVQKRIYHNLSYLLKTKGTERGLRALINCFGISSDILKIKQYGGRNKDERPFFGDYSFYTSSLDKIRLDNTGSLISGSTLSQYTSIVKRDDKYTDDLHKIEVGFSPIDNVDNYIKSHISQSFDIDDYIGDPSDLTSPIYTGLNAIALAATSGSQVSGSYDLQDYVRLIKFYDNTIFKMIKDFIPARVVADTGIVIRPNLLNRSKAKSVSLSGSRPEFTGSIDTAFIGGNNAGEFQISTGESTTAYVDNIQSPTGITSESFSHGQEQPKYNGEFSGSRATITNGNLTANNPYLVTSNGGFNLGTIHYVSSSAEVCVLGKLPNLPQPFIVTSSTQNFQPGDFFNIGTQASGQFIYSASQNTTAPIYSQVTPPFNFGNNTPYTASYLVAADPSKTTPCSASVTILYGTCSINTNTPPNTLSLNPVQPQSLTQTWFNNPNSQILQYTASWTDSSGTPHSQSLVNINPFNITDLTPAVTEGTTVTITATDAILGNICQQRVDVFVGRLNIVAILTGSAGLEFNYSEILATNRLDCTHDDGNFGCSKNAYQFLANPSANTPVSNKGIPGFFANINASPPFSFPSTGLPGGPGISYRVYALQGVSVPQGNPNYGHAYKLQPILDSSPYTQLSEWLQYDQNGDPTNFQMVNYATWNQQLPQYHSRIHSLLSDSNQAIAQYLANPTSTPSIDNTSPWPLTLYTDQYNTIQNFSTVNKPANELVRAYIIQAYDTNISPNTQWNDNLVQITVYGQKNRLTAVEGSGNVVHFEDQYLQVGHDYSQGVPAIQTNGPYTGADIRNRPADYTTGIWVKVPIRKFSNT